MNEIPDYKTLCIEAALREGDPEAFDALPEQVKQEKRDSYRETLPYEFPDLYYPGALLHWTVAIPLGKYEDAFGKCDLGIFETFMSPTPEYVESTLFADSEKSLYKDSIYPFSDIHNVQDTARKNEVRNRAIKAGYLEATIDRPYVEPVYPKE